MLLNLLTHVACYEKDQLLNPVKENLQTDFNFRAFLNCKPF